MCGIAGIVSLDPRRSVDPERLRRMGDVLAHRGPDDSGSWVEGGVGLGSRRLAIVDLAGGTQPMANEDESAWLVHNGEIYNHAALRPRLEGRGHRYRTRCDSEAILHLYEEEGERCVEHLDGMFAFALWDRRRQRLLLARDRLGIKPLYYAEAGGDLLFASEIKALLAAGGITPAFDTAVLPEFLATRFVSGEGTFLRGVRKLLPGRTLTWSAGEGLRMRRYWHPPAGPTEDGAGREERARAVRDRLAAAVESHRMTDVPLGVFLSGGLDSSTLAALMARARSEPVHSFAVGLDEPDANELDYARLVARAIGARHRDMTVGREAFLDALPTLIWHEDEPIAFPSSVLLYFVSRLAREDVKVVLTGEGADELFLGYNWYRVTAWNERLGRPYWALMPDAARARVDATVRRLPRQAARYASRSFLALDGDPRSLCCENFATFREPLRGEVLNGQAGDDPFAPWLRAHAEGTGTMLDRMSHADVQTYLVELLMKQDQMSMAASVESRVPFLDHHLVEHVAALPARAKLRGVRTKAVLRDAAAGLVPDAVLRRRKMGFPVPVGRWLRGASWPLVERYVLSPRALERGLFDPAAVRRLAAEHRAGARHGDRLWLLLNLELWHRIVIEGEAPQALSLREAA